MAQLDAVGKSYQGFVVTKYLPLKELQSVLIEAEHKPTGAHVLAIVNDDPENLFCLSFQTLPSSSNGVAHILEHTVLCGSDRFPIKDPFFSMTRRSLNTFMNAMTGQDFTCYPASSQIEKDFYNLLDVYLDAVFHPELKEKSFLQEGHRLALADPKNSESPLQFQGIVYNEMKGAMSSIDSRLWEALLKRLTPDLPYAFNSGGDPKEIPNLTYEGLKAFHKTFYHPSRCIFFFYGNIPLSKHLDFLVEHTLKGVKKLPPLPPLPKQKRFLSPIKATEKFPIAESESVDKKTQIVFSWLTAPLTEQDEVLALCLLDSLLMDTDASPLKMALLRSGLCTSAESSVDLEMSEVPFSIVCKGCNPEALEGLKQVILDTLGTCSFTQEAIEASLHQLEFQRTEIGAEGVPFGLTLFFRAVIGKHHGTPSENALLIHTLFDALRQRLKSPQYLSTLIHKHLIDNPHLVQLTLIPDPNLEKQEAKEEEERLNALKPGVDLQSLIAQEEALNRFQEETEEQSIECLPKLSLKDVPPSPRDYSLVETDQRKFTTFHHACFTNKILYADLVYDLPNLPAEDLPLLSLYSRCLTELGCGGRNYAENLAYQQAYTGGVVANLSQHIQEMDPNTARPILSIRGKALTRNTEKLFEIFADVATGADLSDTKRLQELLDQHVTALQNRLAKNGLNYAVQMALSGFSSASFIQNEWHGLPYYKSIIRLVKNPKALQQELFRIQETVLGRGNPSLILSCEEAEFERLQTQDFFQMAKRLPHRPLTPWKDSYPLKKTPDEVCFISTPVAFTARGMRSCSYRDRRSPFLLLSTEILDNCFLHKEVREKGGAYGASASYSPSTGNFHLYAYRDPHLARTIGIFQKALEKTANMQFSEKDLEEAKFGVLQSLDAPLPPGTRGMAAYSGKRAGRTLEERQEFRSQILEAKRADIAHAVKETLLSLPSTVVSFLGEELYKKEEGKLKTPLAILPLEN